MVNKKSPVSFLVKLDTGLEQRCHIDQLHLRKPLPEDILPNVTDLEIDDGSIDNDESFELILSQDRTVSPIGRYPSRVRNPPDRFY